MFNNVRLTSFIHEHVNSRICTVSQKRSVLINVKSADGVVRREPAASDPHKGVISSTAILYNNSVQSRATAHLELRPGSFLLFCSIFFDDDFSNLSKIFLLYSILGPSSIERILK